MSIVPLKKITIYGHEQDKKTVLGGLQEMGCLHIIPLRRGESGVGDEESTGTFRDALKFLRSCPEHRPPHTGDDGFDTAVTQAREVLDLENRMQTLEDERDFLNRRISDLEPWGDFVFPPPEEAQLTRFWFYIVPHYQMKQVEETDLIWEAVGSDGQFTYVVVISEEEPETMPVARTHTGGVPLSELQKRREEVEHSLDELNLQRIEYTRWIDLLARYLARMEDQTALEETLHLTFDQNPVFVLQAWIPEERIPQLNTYAEEKHLAVEVDDATREETPPTLMRNKPAVSSGQSLVSFYMTPNYWFADPSTIVFFSFILFFGMIVGDVGYGLLLGGVVAALWGKMGQSETGRRFRVLFTALVSATIVWGALVGSYFGVTPDPDSIFGAIKLLDLNDYDTMMMISIAIGASHVILANLMEVFRHGLSPAALGSGGWIIMVVGGLILGGGGGPIGYWFLGGGALCILLFTGAEGFGKRLVDGLLGLTRITNAFGDILSYLRLFALGLATSSLAVAFNDLAGQVRDGMPGLGLLFAIIILLIGHTLNFALAMMSGFVHGLRLNFIEFFNWSAPEEGVSFRAFAKKENV